MIVVGTVRAVRIVGSGIPARKAPDLLLDRMRVDVDVETVLRGDWHAPQLQFDFFAYSGKNRGGYDGPSPYRVEPGDRSVFFLTPDSGQLRSVADVRGGYSLRVWSGMHKDFKRSESPGEAVTIDGRAVGNDISAILLELGDGPDEGAMADALGTAAFVSDELASRKATVSRLRQLFSRAQDRSLKISACKLLSEQYAGQSGCLYELQNDLSFPSSERERVREILSKRKTWDARLKQELRTQPMYAFHIDSVVVVRDELELLMADPDPELRRLACDVLRQNFPRTATACK